LALAAELAARQGRVNAGAWFGPWPEVVVTDQGGHNGFHAPGDCDEGCWSDQLAALWLRQVLVSRTAN
jgi:hypothetical protein